MAKLTKSEKETLRDVAFYHALKRLLYADRLSYFLWKARDMAVELGDHALADEILRLNAKAPDEAYKLADALGIVPEDTEYVNDNDYDRLQAKLRGIDLDDDDEGDGYVREDPSELLKKLKIRLK